MTRSPAGSERSQRDRSASHELLTETYEHESVVNIYQSRLQSLFYDLAAMSRAIGMDARVELTPSRRRIELATGSYLALRPFPAEIPRELLAKLDQIFAAARDDDARGAARVFLLAQIDAESRRTGGRVELRRFEGIRIIFAAQYPEYATGLTDERLQTALDVWVRRGGPRKNKTIPKKWVALANLMNEVGLGPIKASSLAQQWLSSPCNQAVSRRRTPRSGN